MNDTNVFILKSTRFGEMEVSKDSIIDIPQGLIGFPEAKRFVMLDHTPPFSWLHSVDDPNLAFVVVDGSFIIEKFDVRIPYGAEPIDLRENEDFAILSVVTVRGGFVGTTANTKAPVFVNIRNRKGVQIIFDNPELSTRYSLMTPEESEAKKEEKK